MASKKKTTDQIATIALTEAERQAVEVAAASNNVSVEDYLRIVIISALPVTAQKSLMNAAIPDVQEVPQVSLIEQAQNRAKAYEQPSPPVVHPVSAPQVQAPARRVGPSSPQEGATRSPKASQYGLPQVPPGDHPCYYLSNSDIPSHLRGQCQGVCRHKTQDGRVCFFPPTSAHRCDLYVCKTNISGPR